MYRAYPYSGIVVAYPQHIHNEEDDRYGEIHRSGYAGTVMPPPVHSTLTVASSPSPAAAAFMVLSMPQDIEEGLATPNANPYHVSRGSPTGVAEISNIPTSARATGVLLGSGRTCGGRSSALVVPFSDDIIDVV